MLLFHFLRNVSDYGLEVNICTFVVLVELSDFDAEVEGSFSGLRRIKSYLRNRMMSDERLSGLALMHLHHDLDIDVDEICIIYLCYQAQEEDVPRVHPLRVEFKYTVRGQGIITCNRDWWEGVWGVWERSNLPQKSSTVLSEPKFGPPIKNSWIRPCICNLESALLGQ